MPVFPKTSRLAASALAALLAVPSGALADYCTSLRTELASLNGGARSPGQLMQQLRSAEMQAGRAGCFGGFFFSAQRRSSRCPALLGRLDVLRRGAWSVAWGGDAVQSRRASLQRGLARAGCNGSRMAGSYRTLCVRVCDGYYFPISYATSPNRFKTDEAACKSMYPPDEAGLYVHRTVADDVTQAVSLAGEPYAKQSFAFAYRSSYDHACATLFRSGSGALVAVKKAPTPASVVAASLAADVSAMRSGRALDESDTAAAELPANLDPAVQAAEAAETRANADGIRMVGPVKYPEPHYLGSIGGAPPKLAARDSGQLDVVSPDQPPVTASMLPNPFGLPARPPAASIDSRPANRVEEARSPAQLFPEQ